MSDIEPGSFTLEGLDLISRDGSKVVDISDLLERFEFSEAITQPYIMGRIIIRDSINMVGDFPIIGEETIKAKWKTLGDVERSIEMDVISVGGIVADRNMSSRVIELSLISKNGSKDSGLFVSAHGNGNVSDMASDVFSNIGDTLHTVPTDGVVELCFPKRSVGEHMRHLCAKAYSASDPTAIFTYFESKTGQHFTSMTDLHQKALNDAHGPYFYEPSILNTEDRTRLVYQISDFNVPSRSESTIQASSGRYGMNIGSASLQTKTWNIAEWDIRDNFDAANPFPTSFTQSDSFVDEKTTNKKTEWVYSFEDQLIDTIYPNRHAYAYWQSQSIILLELLGKADMTCGEGIEISLQVPKSDVNENSLLKDESLSGHWLIRACTHVFDKTTYTMQVECGRMGT